MLNQLVEVLTDPDRLAVEVLRFFTSEPPVVETAEGVRSPKRVEEKQSRLARLLVQGDIPEDILAVQAKQLKRNGNNWKARSLVLRRGRLCPRIRSSCSFLKSLSTSAKGYRTPKLTILNFCYVPSTCG